MQPKKLNQACLFLGGVLVCSLRRADTRARIAVSGPESEEKACQAN